MLGNGQLIHPACVSSKSQNRKLEPKAMAVLCQLASRPGVVIKRQELEDTVWADRVVGYDALSNAIIKLRRALGDQARDPRYIETVAKSGYRLIAQVTQSAEKLPPSGTTDTESFSKRLPRKLRRFFMPTSPIIRA